VNLLSHRAKPHNGAGDQLSLVRLF
jgi:hypothetical protein